MNEGNKVVLKINYQGAEREKSEPKMVEEWNTKRLLIALILLLIVVIAFFIYIFSGEAENAEVQKVQLDQQKNRVAATINSSAKSEINSPENRDKNVPVKRQTHIEESNEAEIKSIEFNTQDKVVEVIKQSPKVLNDSKVVRALLTRGVSNKEPLDNISSFITVNKSKATGVFYFTELVDMEGQIITHQWFWKNKPVYEKKFKIFGDRWRIATSKVIPYSIAGPWMVRLVDTEANILNEIRFEVIKE